MPSCTCNVCVLSTVWLSGQLEHLDTLYGSIKDTDAETAHHQLEKTRRLTDESTAAFSRGVLMNVARQRQSSADVDVTAHRVFVNGYNCDITEPKLREDSSHVS